MIEKACKRIKKACKCLFYCKRSGDWVEKLFNSGLIILLSVFGLHLIFVTCRTAGKYSWDWSWDGLLFLLSQYKFVAYYIPAIIGFIGLYLGNKRIKESIKINKYNVKESRYKEFSDNVDLFFEKNDKYMKDNLIANKRYIFSKIYELEKNGIISISSKQVDSIFDIINHTNLVDYCEKYIIKFHFYTKSEVNNEYQTKDRNQLWKEKISTWEWFKFLKNPNEPNEILCWRPLFYVIRYAIDDFHDEFGAELHLRFAQHLYKGNRGEKGGYEKILKYGPIRKHENDVYSPEELKRT